MWQPRRFKGIDPNFTYYELTNGTICDIPRKEYRSRIAEKKVLKINFELWKL
jgi:hypothetical protein